MKNSYEMTRFDLLPNEIVEKIYIEKHKLEMKEVLNEMCKNGDIYCVAVYDDNLKFERWVEYSGKDYYNTFWCIEKGRWLPYNI